MVIKWMGGHQAWQGSVLGAETEAGFIHIVVEKNSAFHRKSFRNFKKKWWLFLYKGLWSQEKTINNCHINTS